MSSQAPVDLRQANVIHWINHYPVKCITLSAGWWFIQCFDAVSLWNVNWTFCDVTFSPTCLIFSFMIETSISFSGCCSRSYSHDTQGYQLAVCACCSSTQHCFKLASGVWQVACCGRQAGGNTKLFWHSWCKLCILFSLCPQDQPWKLN